MTATIARPLPIPPPGPRLLSWHLRAWAWSITLIYALVATLWIYFSDQALMALAPDTQTLARWSVNKGIGFVAVTSVLLLLLINRAFRALEKAYDELHALNDTLEAKVAARTSELESAVVRAEAADRLKSAFLATMSHELRTPLNSIIGFTGIVLQEMAGPLTPEQHKQLGMVRNSARHLLELINDVLDLSKIEAGQLQVKAEPFDVREAINRAQASLMPLAEAKGLTLRVEIDPEVGTLHSDRRRVEQIVLNLLSNGLKFTDRGGVSLSADIDPDFRVTLGDPPVPALRVRIRDTGIGIAAEDLQGLFQPFSQVDSGLTRQHEGTGLGLAICRRLATLLGGTISVSSQSNQGSEFTLTLPLELP